MAATQTGPSGLGNPLLQHLTHFTLRLRHLGLSMRKYNRASRDASNLVLRFPEHAHPSHISSPLISGLGSLLQMFQASDNRDVLDEVEDPDVQVVEPSLARDAAPVAGNAAGKLDGREAAYALPLPKMSQRQCLCVFLAWPPQALSRPLQALSCMDSHVHESQRQQDREKRHPACLDVQTGRAHSLLGSRPLCSEAGEDDAACPVLPPLRSVVNAANTRRGPEPRCKPKVFGALRGVPRPHQGRKPSAGCSCVPASPQRLGDDVTASYGTQEQLTARVEEENRLRAEKARLEAQASVASEHKPGRFLSRRME